MRDEDYREWIRFANMDLDSAKHLFEKMYPPPLEIICYHYQQAAEKFIKALLVYNKIEVIKTHDLVVLIGRLKDIVPANENVMVACARLIPYSVATRYPQDVNIDENKVKLAFQYTNIIKEWAEENIH